MNDELIKLLIELKSDISVLKNEVDRTNERLSYIPRDLMSRFDDVVEDITKIEMVLHRSNVGFFAQNKFLSIILANVAQETPLPSRGGMNCDSFYRMHMAR